MGARMIGNAETAVAQAGAKRLHGETDAATNHIEQPTTSFNIHRYRVQPQLADMMGGTGNDLTMSKGKLVPRDGGAISLLHIPTCRTC